VELSIAKGANPLTRTALERSGKSLAGQKYKGLADPARGAGDGHAVPVGVAAPVCGAGGLAQEADVGRQSTLAVGRADVEPVVLVRIKSALKLAVRL